MGGRWGLWTRGTYAQGFESGVVLPPSAGFGGGFGRAGVCAVEAVLVVPLVAALALVGFKLLEGLLLEDTLYLGRF